MNTNSPCLRAHDLIDKLTMYAPPPTHKRRGTLQKATAPKLQKVTVQPRRCEELHQTVCEYSASCFTCPLKDCIQPDKACERLNCL